MVLKVVKTLHRGNCHSSIPESSENLQGKKKKKGRLEENNRGKPQNKKHSR